MTFDLTICDPGPLLSPSLLVFRDAIRRNLEAMVGLAGDPSRLRPHVKTHKMPALVRMCEERGVHKHKCATIAEAEMIAQAGGTDVLLAYPLVGPNPGRLARLVKAYPETQFRATVDGPEAVRVLSEALATMGVDRPLPVLVDLEVGMGRTGLAPGPGVENLYEMVVAEPRLVADGLHAYDGHLQIVDPDERRRAASSGQEATLELRARLEARGWTVPRLVFGGTPTFPAHAALEAEGVECSPGTCLLHDMSYLGKFPDLPFSPAAAILTRVVSRPRPDRLCLDVGHKAVAADPAGPRVWLPDLPDAVFLTHSEEHLVVQTPRAGEFAPGTALLAVPVHICPTCALHRRAYVVEAGEVVDEWEVAARDRVLTV